MINSSLATVGTGTSIHTFQWHDIVLRFGIHLFYCNRQEDRYLHNIILWWARVRVADMLRENMSKPCSSLATFRSRRLKFYADHWGLMIQDTLQWLVHRWEQRLEHQEISKWFTPLHTPFRHRNPGGVNHLGVDEYHPPSHPHPRDS